MNHLNGNAFLSQVGRVAPRAPGTRTNASGARGATRPTLAFVLGALLFSFQAFSAAPSKPFELRDGDRVVFLGDTLMEREKDFGYIELMMTLRFPDRNVTFRNLGWSADTPVGISRVSFDWPKGEGEMFRQLMEQIKQVQPTVVVFGYGMASSLEDAALTEMEGRATRVPDSNNNPNSAEGAGNQSGTRVARPSNETTTRLDKFVTDYNKLIDGILALNKETRFILLSPIRHEKLPPPLPDPARHNEMLAGYVKAIQGVAEKRGFVFVDLFDGLKEVLSVGPKGTIPIPLTDNGIHLNKFGYSRLATTIADGLSWIGLTGALSPTWQRFDYYEPLRQNIIAKNQLFFHRWRPENSTYLFLFRKHEQGKNAQEIPKFDPLIEAEEKKIATLRKQPPQAPSPGQLARKPSQNPLPEKPATPFKTQPHPTFQLADPNLEVTLWAENPLLAKPIAMNWDARGRLFIASSSLYPQIEPGQAQDDKILILEDTNGDGQADKTTVFADGLLIPTGIEPGDGGCYVGQSTELLHFADTDGDGISDQRRVVLSGFGTEDTHHILHTLRWGPDGRLYMNQSIYIHSHIETPHGVVRLNSGGTLALRPDTLELGVTMKGLVNGWGHVWDDFGQEFQTDGAGGTGLNWNIPQATFLTYEGARRIIGSVSPGSYPKFCGLELIKSERFPKEWQGNAVTLDFRANRMVRFEILEQGAGYTTKQHEFLRSTNITFRPIDIKLGPDGALYIADWSNPIIQHGEVDFRDPRRDREHGRIWRVGYKGGKDVKVPELVKMNNGQLTDQVLSPNDFTEKQARQSLVERYRNGNEDTKHSVRLAVTGLATRASSNEAMLQALWLYQAIDWHQHMGAQNLLLRLLNAPSSKVFGRNGRIPGDEDFRARAAAVHVLGAWSGNTPGIPSLAKPRHGENNIGQNNTGQSGPTPLEALAVAVQDDHPRVRIEALRALARIPTARSAELALSVLGDAGDRGRPARTGQRPADQPERAGKAQNDSASPRAGAIGGTPMTATGTVAIPDSPELDPFLEYALWLTINDLAEPWAAAVESGAWKIEGREKQLQYALKAIEPKVATRLMSRLVGHEPLPRDGSGGMVELIGQAGSSLHMRMMFDQVLAGGFNDEGALRALNSFIDAARLRNVRPSGDVTGVSKLMETGNDGVRASAAKLAGTWKLATAAPALGKLAGDTATPVVLRQASIEGLRDLGGRNSIMALRSLAKDNDASIQRSSAAALATTDLNGSMPQILEVVSATTKEDDALALWRSLLAAKGASPALAKALATNSLPEPAARAGLRVAREGGRNEPNLVLALNRAGGLSDPSAALNDNEIHAIAYEVTKGDPARGESIYRTKQLGCVLCHSVGGAGGKVGPDLTSLGASTPVADYLVESVLLPNKRVKEGFNSVQVTTKDGEDVSGNLVREDTEQLILRDATAREVSIAKRNIAARKMGGSLMPAGLLDFISPQERLDLYAFLAQLGKPGPYDATKQNVARAWRLNPKVGTVNADEMLKSDLRGKDWMPLYATVGGTLPKADVMAELEGKDATVWVASRFQTANAGPARFRMTGTASPKAWIDGKPIGGDSDLSADLPAGQHTFFLKVTTTDIAQGLKLESNDVTFLTE